MLEEFRHNVEWGVTWLLGKGGIKLLLLGLAGKGGASGLIGVALGSGLSGYLAHVDHHYDELKLLNQYRPEIAAKTHKSPKEVTMDDLRRVAKGDEEQGIYGNKVLREALKINNRRRFIKTLVSVATGVGTFFAVPALLAAAAPGTALATAVAFVGGPFVALPLAGMVVGFVAGRTLGRLAGKIAGLDTPLVNDRIRELGQLQRVGQEITPEQLLDVFVALNRALGKEIETGFGKSYEDLSSADKQRFLQQSGAGLGLKELASDLNCGLVRVSELAFRASGQASGVKRLDTPPLSFKQRAHQAAQCALDAGREKMGHAWDVTRDALHSAADKAQQRFSKSTPAEVAEEIADDAPQTKFTDRIAPKLRSSSYAESVQPSAATPSTVPTR